MLKRIGYLLVTAILVGGPPLVLTRFDVRPDLDWDALPARLSNGDVPYELVVAVLAAVAWFAWFSLVLSIVIETIATVRSTEAPQIRLFPGTQGAARRLVAGALLSANSLAPALSGGLAAIPMMPETEMTLPTLQTTERSPDQVSDTAQTEQVGRYRVQRNDTFMTLAAQISGAGDDWRDLRTANIGVRMPSGMTISAETISIEPGTRMIVPADSALAETVTPAETVPGASELSETTSTIVVTPFDLDTGHIDSTTPASTTNQLTAAHDTTSNEQTAADTTSDGSISDQATSGDDDAAESTSGQETAAEVTLDYEVIGTWAVAEGDNFWALSGTVLETALDRSVSEDEHRDYWVAVVDANAASTLSGDPDLIFAGESFDLLLPGIDGADLDRLSDLEQFTPADIDEPPAPVTTKPEAPVVEESAAEPESEAPVVEESAAEPEATATTVPTAEAEPTPPASSVVRTAAVPTVDASVPANSAADSGHGLGTRLGVTAVVGVAAAGVLRRLTRNRELGLAQRAPGERVDPNPVEVAAIEAEQRNLSAPHLRERLMTALQVIRTECEGHGAVMLAQVSPDGEMEFAFDGHVPPPTNTNMWDASESQTQSVWVLRGEPVYTGEAYAIAPLVGIGDGTYLSLTAAGVLGIGGGTPMQRSDHLRSIIHDLAYGPLDGELLLRLGAIGEAGEATVAGVPAFEMSEVLGEIEQLLELVDESHEREGTDSMAMLCHRGEVHNSEVMVVVCAESEMIQLRDVIAQVDANPGRYPIAFIVLGEGINTPDVAWTATLDDEMGVMLNADVLGGALTLQPAMLGREQAAALNGALATAVDSRPKSLGLTEQTASASGGGANVVVQTSTEDHLEDMGNPDTEPSAAELALEANNETDETGDETDGGTGVEGSSGDGERFAGPMITAASGNGDGDVGGEGLSDDELDDDEAGDHSSGGAEMSLAAMADAVGVDFDPAEVADQVSAVIAGLDPQDVGVRGGQSPTTEVEEETGAFAVAYANRLVRRRVRVELLGPVEISGTDPGTELSNFARALLAGLVFKKRPVTFSEMVKFIWPDAEVSPSRARAVKRELRNAIGAALVDGAGSRISVEVESDLEEFERLTNHARQLSGAEEIETLQEALDLVRATPLAGAEGRAWAWVDSNDRPREVLRQRVTDVALELCRRAGESGSWDIALKAAQRGLAVEPYSAALMAMQTQAHVELGEPGIATRELNAWETTFETHFECEPPTGPREVLESSASTTRT